MSERRDKPLTFTSWKVVKCALAVWIPVAMLTGALTSAFYDSEMKRTREAFAQRETGNVRVLGEVIISHFEKVMSDLRVISNIKEVVEFLDAENETTRAALAQKYLMYIEQKGIYDQIRLLNEKGMEVVRTNIKNGEPYIVPEDQLQYKGQRYYFRDAFKLEPGEIFVSPFDLNIEHGQIEQPLKPTIRLGTPVFDGQGNKRGIVLLNYLGTDVLEHFEWVAANTSKGEVTLLNKDGFWLDGPRAEDKWGFMYEDGANLTFHHAFPGLWEQIDSKNSGHLVSEDGLFVFATTYPLKERMISSTGSREAFGASETDVEGRTYHWKIISRVSPEILKENPTRLLHKVLLWDGALLVTAVIVFWLVAYVWLRRKRTEEMLAQHRAQLEASNKELEAFSYSVSHDLRAPLRAIDGFSQILLEDYAARLDAEGQRLISVVRRNTRKMGALIDDLLKFSRLRRQEVTYSRVDMEALVQDVLRELKGDVAERTVQFEIAPLPPAWGDQAMLRQVWQNLLSNAVKYTRSREVAEITVDGGMENHEVRYSVKDNGVGFDMRYVDKLFNVFQRLHREEDFEGTGVGLALIQRVVHRYGGRVWAEGEVERGARFHFTLPHKKEA